MRRGANHTVFSQVKRLLDGLRSPSCQQLHRGSSASVRSSTRTEQCTRADFEYGHALLRPSTHCASPVADAQTCQLHCMSTFSAQQQHTQQEGPEISLLDPALQRQWDHAANAHLGNTVIKPYRHLKAWWTCDQCPDGHLHSWSATVHSRSIGKGCPQCNGHKVCKHNCLATRAPMVASQWDYEANSGTPKTVVAKSNQVFGWRCDACGHKWSATANARVHKHNSSPCPSCSAAKRSTIHPTFAECNHALLAEWDDNRNATHGNYPDRVRLRSGKQIFWLCTKCPAGAVHSWIASAANRTGHCTTGCPMCAGRAACQCNSLQALYPDIAAQWDHGKNNGKPKDYAARARYCAWWVSPQRGSWQQTIQSYTVLEDQRNTRLKRIQQRQMQP